MFDGLTIFNGVNDKELETLSYLMQERYIKKGEFIFKQGDEALAIYVIKSGSIVFLKDNLYFGTLKSDSMFGEKAYLEGFNKRKLSAKALEDTQLIVMLYDNFKDFLNKHPEFKTRMKKYFSSYNIDAKLEK